MAKISVVMGVYNPVDFARLERAVGSIIDQTFKDWELIIYNDGSAPLYSAGILQLEKLDRRIKVIQSSKNQGLAHALNCCISASIGEYIARMDDDDFSFNTRLDTQYNFLKAHAQFGWVGSSAVMADSGGIWGKSLKPAHPQKYDFLFNSPFIHPTVMFKKSVLLKCGAYSEDKSVLGLEDYELFIRLKCMGYEGYNLKAPQLIYYEDLSSYKRRTYKRRLGEFKLRIAGFKKLGILKPRWFFYIIKPLVVGMVPARILHYYKKRRGQKIFEN